MINLLKNISCKMMNNYLKTEKYIKEGHAITQMYRGSLLIG